MLTLEENLSDTVPIKVVLIGDTAVGKKSIGDRFVYDRFSGETEVGSAGYFVRRIIEVDVVRYELRIWGTSGQSSFIPITLSSMSDTLVIIYVYDVGSQESFETIRKRREMFIRENAISSVQLEILVGAKVDLQFCRCIERGQGASYAKHNGMLFFECSAKTGFNVEKIFYAIPENIELRNVELIRKKRVQKLNRFYSKIKNGEFGKSVKEEITCSFSFVREFIIQICPKLEDLKTVSTLINAINFKKPYKMNTLDLSNLSMGSVMLNLFCDQLISFSVNKLNLSGNKFGNNDSNRVIAINAIKYIFHKISQLTVLELANNMLTDEGALTLASILEKTKFLKLLNLSHNGISAVGAEKLVKAAKSHPSLSTLNLSHNIIYIEDGQLKDLIRAAKTSLQIDVSQNYIGFTALPSNVDVYFNQNKLYYDGALQIMPGFLTLHSNLNLERYKEQLKQGRDVAVVCVYHKKVVLGHVFINFTWEKPCVAYIIKDLAKQHGLRKSLSRVSAMLLNTGVVISQDDKEQVEAELNDLSEEESAYIMDRILLTQHALCYRNCSFRNKPTKHLLMANLTSRHGIFKSDESGSVQSYIDPKFTIKRNQYVVYLACKQGNEHAMLFIEGMSSFGQMFLLKAHFGPKRGISGSRLRPGFKGLMKDLVGEGMVELKLLDIERFLSDMHDKKDYILKGWEVPRVFMSLKKYGAKKFLQEIAKEAKGEAPGYFKLESAIFKPLKLLSKSLQSQAEHSYNCLTWAIEKLKLLDVKLNNNWLVKTFPITVKIIRAQQKYEKKKAKKKCISM